MTDEKNKRNTPDGIDRSKIGSSGTKKPRRGDGVADLLTRQLNYEQDRDKKSDEDKKKERQKNGKFHGKKLKGDSEYEKADIIRGKTLGQLAAERRLNGESLGDSLKGAIGDKIGALGKKVKSIFDPLNGLSKISPLLAAHHGMKHGRSLADMQYHMPDVAFPEEGEESSSEKPQATPHKEKPTTTPAASEPTEKPTATKADDTSKSKDTASPAAKSTGKPAKTEIGVLKQIYTVLKEQMDDNRKWREKDLVKAEVAANFDEEKEEKTEKRHQELLKALSGVGKGVGEKPTAKKDKDSKGLLETLGTWAMDLLAIEQIWSKLKGAFNVVKGFFSIFSKEGMIGRFVVGLGELFEGGAVLEVLAGIASFFTGIGEVALAAAAAYAVAKGVSWLWEKLTGKSSEANTKKYEKATTPPEIQKEIDQRTLRGETDEAYEKRMKMEKTAIDNAKGGKVTVKDKFTGQVKDVTEQYKKDITEYDKEQEFKKQDPYQQYREKELKKSYKDSSKRPTYEQYKASPEGKSLGEAKGMGGSGSSDAAMKFFQDRGYTKEQAAGIVGNLQAESGKTMKTNALGDNGKAYGIAQWHPDRQKNFEKQFGHPIQESTFYEQLSFVDWELNHTEGKAGARIRQAKTAEESAKTFDSMYERSSGAASQNRIANANALMGNTGDGSKNDTDKKENQPSACNVTSGTSTIPTKSETSSGGSSTSHVEPVKGADLEKYKTQMGGFELDKSASPPTAKGADVAKEVPILTSNDTINKSGFQPETPTAKGADVAKEVPILTSNDTINKSGFQPETPTAYREQISEKSSRESHIEKQKDGSIKFIINGKEVDAKTYQDNDNKNRAEMEDDVDDSASTPTAKGADVAKEVPALTSHETSPTAIREKLLIGGEPFTSGKKLSEKQINVIGAAVAMDSSNIKNYPPEVIEQFRTPEMLKSHPFIASAVLATNDKHKKEVENTKKIGEFLGLTPKEPENKMGGKNFGVKTTSSWDEEPTAMSLGGRDFGITDNSSWEDNSSATPVTKNNSMVVQPTVSKVVNTTMPHQSGIPTQQSSNSNVFGGQSSNSNVSGGQSSNSNVFGGQSSNSNVSGGQSNVNNTTSSVDNSSSKGYIPGQKFNVDSSSTNTYYSPKTTATPVTNNISSMLQTNSDTSNLTDTSSNVDNSNTTATQLSKPNQLATRASVASNENRSLTGPTSDTASPNIIVNSPTTNQMSGGGGRSGGGGGTSTPSTTVRNDEPVLTRLQYATVRPV